MVLVIIFNNILFVKLLTIYIYNIPLVFIKYANIRAT